MREKEFDSLTHELQAARLPMPPVARAVRQAAGATQSRVAEALGVHRLTVSRWETGERRPRGEMRARYASLLAELAQVSN